MRVFQEHDVTADRITHGAIRPRHFSPDLANALMGKKPPIDVICRGDFALETDAWTVSLNPDGNATIAEDAVNMHVSERSGIKLHTEGDASPGTTRFHYKGPNEKGWHLSGPMGLFLFLATGAGGDLGNIQRLSLRLSNGSGGYYTRYLILNGDALCNLVENKMMYIPLSPTGWTMCSPEWTHMEHIDYMEIHVQPTANQTADLTVGGMTVEAFDKGHLVLGLDGPYTDALAFMAEWCRQYQLPLTVFGTVGSMGVDRPGFEDLRTLRRDFPVEVVSHGYAGDMDALNLTEAMRTVGWAKEIISNEGFGDGADIFSPLSHKGECTETHDVDTDILFPLGITMSRHQIDRRTKYNATYGQDYPPKIDTGMHFLPDFLQCPNGAWEQLSGDPPEDWADKITKEVRRVRSCAEHRGCYWSFCHKIQPAADMVSPGDDGNTSEELMTAVLTEVVKQVAAGALEVITPSQHAGLTFSRPGPWRWPAYEGFAPHLMRRDATGALVRCW